jgi:hypothetical protein
LVFFFFFWKLRVAKGQPTQAVISQPPSNKNAPLTSEWDHTSQPITQQPIMPYNTFERPVAEMAEEVPTMEYEGLISSSPTVHFHYGIRAIKFLKSQ